MDRDEFYTVSEAAKVLGLGERRVRQLVSEGEVEGERVGNVWQIFRHSVHSFRDEHGVRERPRAGSEWPPEALDAFRRAEDLQRALGRLEGEMKVRAELTSVAESTLKEQLERERERAEREREERLQAQDEAQKLRAELDEARKSWFRRIFGA